MACRWRRFKIVLTCSSRRREWPLFANGVLKWVKGGSLF